MVGIRQRQPWCSLTGLSAVVHDNTAPAMIFFVLPIQEERDILLDAEEIRSMQVDIPALLRFKTIAFNKRGVVNFDPLVHVCLLLAHGPNR